MNYTDKFLRLVIVRGSVYELGLQQKILCLIFYDSFHDSCGSGVSSVCREGRDEGQ